MIEILAVIYLVLLIPFALLFGIAPHEGLGGLAKRTWAWLDEHPALYFIYCLFCAALWPVTIGSYLVILPPSLLGRLMIKYRKFLTSKLESGAK